MLRSCTPSPEKGPNSFNKVKRTFIIFGTLSRRYVFTRVLAVVVSLRPSVRLSQPGTDSTLGDEVFGFLPYDSASKFHAAGESK